MIKKRDLAYVAAASLALAPLQGCRSSNPNNYLRETGFISADFYRSNGHLVENLEIDLDSDKRLDKIALDPKNNSISYFRNIGSNSDPSYEDGKKIDLGLSNNEKINGISFQTFNGREEIVVITSRGKRILTINRRR
jgi:hypothetical protein